nr:12355_t:CDS:2 [Entrophospora candida]
MEESVEVAFSYIQSYLEKNKENFEKELNILKKKNINIHAPEGAVKKDGPSAGITLTTAILSALTNQTVPTDIGMTGEITSKGKILKIGGLKEKAIAAHRSGIKTIIIPKANETDIEDIPQEIREVPGKAQPKSVKKLKIIMVENYEEAAIKKGMLGHQTIQELQKKQKELDDFIVQKKNLTDADSKSSFIRTKIALLVEIGELANDFGINFVDYKFQKLVPEPDFNELLLAFFSETESFSINADSLLKGVEKEILVIKGNSQIITNKKIAGKIRDEIIRRSKNQNCSGKTLKNELAQKMGMKSETEIRKAYMDKNRWQNRIMEVDSIENAKKVLHSLRNGTITAFGGRFRGASYDKNAERIVKQAQKSLKEAIKNYERGDVVNVKETAIVPSSYYNWWLIVPISGAILVLLLLAGVFLVKRKFKKWRSISLD